MFKSFDDLFNEFFNRKNNFNDKLKKIREDEQKFLDNLSDFLNLPQFNGEKDLFSDSFGENLGEPNEVQTWQEGDVYYIREIWNTPNGTFEKILVSDNPDDIKNVSNNKKEKSLELQLEEAIAAEDFEKAAQIRDLINPPKQEVKKRNRKKKSDEQA